MNIQTYLSRIFQDSKITGQEKAYIKTSLKKEPWDVHVGLIAFHPDAWAIGCGFPGNYSMFRVRDFRKYKRPLGRKRTGPENDVVYVDQPGMNKLVRVPLITQKEIREKGLDYGRRSIYNFPYRFHPHFDLTVKVQGQVCGRSELTDEEISILEGMMTPQETALRNSKVSDVSWSEDTPSVEMPIRIRIEGSDDGASHKLYQTVEEAMKDALVLEGKIWNDCNQIYDLGFNRTD